MNTTVQCWLAEAVRKGATNAPEALQEAISQKAVSLHEVCIDGLTRTVVRETRDGFYPEPTLHTCPSLRALSSVPLRLNQRYLALVRPHWPTGKGGLDWVLSFLTYLGTYFQMWRVVQGRFYTEGGISHINHMAFRAAVQFANSYPCTLEQLTHVMGEIPTWKKLLSERGKSAIPSKKWWGRVALYCAAEEIKETGRTHYICYADGRTDGLAHTSLWAHDHKGVEATLYDGQAPVDMISSVCMLDRTTTKKMVTPLIYGAGAKTLMRALLGFEKGWTPEEEKAAWNANPQEPYLDLSYEKAGAAALEVCTAGHILFHHQYPRVSWMQAKIREVAKGLLAAGHEVSVVINGVRVAPYVAIQKDVTALERIYLICEGHRSGHDWCPVEKIQTPSSVLALITQAYEGQIVALSALVLVNEGIDYLPIHDGHGVPVTAFDRMQNCWTEQAKILLAQGPNPFQQLCAVAPTGQYSLREGVHHLKA